MYQSLKAQVMASAVADAAGVEADFAFQSVRADRLMNKLPGTRIGTTNFSQFGLPRESRGRRRHKRTESGSSRDNGQRDAETNTGLAWNSNIQNRGLVDRRFTGRKLSSHI